MTARTRFAAAFLFALPALSACQPGGAAADVTFKPAQVTGTGPSFQGLSYVYATELSPSAIGYEHPPRTLYLTFSAAPDGKMSLEEAPLAQLRVGHATLRVAEHQQVPRLYIVEFGSVQVTQQQGGGTWGQYTVAIDAVLIDPLDGSARIHLNTTFVAPIEVIS